MTNRLLGKTAIITGGGSGIGRATALLFAAEGAQVLIADWHEDAAAAVAAEITGAGGSAHALKVDVSVPEDIERMVETAVREFGRLDVLFNNAGIEGEQAPTGDCTIQNWDRVISINLRGVFLGMKYAIPAMLKQRGGAIVNNASVAGLVGFAGLPAYCAAKGGVVQLTKAAALEYVRQGIRVNVICPGIIQTPMVDRFVQQNEAAQQALTALEPVGRFGTAEEVARLVLFLASDDSSFCTGAPFIVDGGLVAG